MRDQEFNFRGTSMTIRAVTEETGTYALIDMRHPPNVGPALHIHPRGPESFFILEGIYTFYRNDEVVTVHAGLSIAIPTGIPHRYTSGPQGGRVLVITPPALEHYFWLAAERLRTGSLPIEEEFALAAQYGQDFLDRAGHWGAKDADQMEISK